MRLQVAGILVRDAKVLLCRRSATRSYYPGVWDFPGGHKEAGETDADALARELHEELGIHISAPVDPPLAHMVDAALGFDLKLWAIRDWCGVPENMLPEEHEAIEWLSAEQACALTLALPGYPEIIARAIASLS